MKTDASSVPALHQAQPGSSDDFKTGALLSNFSLVDCLLAEQQSHAVCDIVGIALGSARVIRCLQDRWVFQLLFPLLILLHKVAICQHCIRFSQGHQVSARQVGLPTAFFVIGCVLHEVAVGWPCTRLS